MGRLVSRHSALWLVALSLCGCGGGYSAGGSGRPVMLFGAASASGALDEIRGQFKRETGTDVKASYAAASALAQQIAYGAEAGVLVSANTQWADHLDQKALVKRRRDLLGNRLVIIVPADSLLDEQKPEDLVDKAVRRLALADSTAVPAGIYARQALTKPGILAPVCGLVPSDTIRVSGPSRLDMTSWVRAAACPPPCGGSTQGGINTAPEALPLSRGIAPRASEGGDSRPRLEPDFLRQRGVLEILDS